MLLQVKFITNICIHQHIPYSRNNYNVDVPAMLRVLFVVNKIVSAVSSLHCSTVPLKLKVALNVRVEVILAT